MPKDQHNLVPRTPVVVVMGHIDHGKSTLLDYIRKANIVETEAGGITQHVGAYEAEHISADGKKHKITFLDTPGHAAFTGIRMRGARAADIAILVVSAEDGVKPQTVEAFKSIQAEKIPFIVAINKIDKPNADVDRAKTSLAEHEIYVEGWGGDVPFVAISAFKGTNVSELLDLIILQAELLDLKTDTMKPAEGVVVESSLDTRKGVSATVLIKDGALNVGEFVVTNDAFAPIRFIEDFLGNKIETAAASMPVRIYGWSELPASGSVFHTVESKKQAEKLVDEFKSKERQKPAQPAPIIKQATIAADKIKPGEKEQPTVVILPIAIKADVIGSLEGVRQELAKVTHDKVQLKIVAEGIGDINENDVKLAMSDPSIHLVGFNVMPDKKSAAMIERSPVPLHVSSFKVIYELIEYVQGQLTSRIPKEYIEQVTGRAKILALFSKDRDKQVVGGKVETGTVESGNDVRIMRRDAEIGRGKIRELQEKKLRVREVAEGHEFGMMVEAKMELAPGDRVEAVRTVEKI